LIRRSAAPSGMSRQGGWVASSPGVHKVPGRSESNPLETWGAANKGLRV
jgi:hypothetical protein